MAPTITGPSPRPRPSPPPASSSACTPTATISCGPGSWMDTPLPPTRISLKISGARWPILTVTMRLLAPSATPWMVRPIIGPMASWASPPSPSKPAPPTAPAAISSPPSAARMALMACRATSGPRTVPSSSTWPRSPASLTTSPSAPMPRPWQLPLPPFSPASRSP